MSGTRAAGEAAGDAQHAAHDGDENPAVERGMSRDVFNLPQNIVLNGIKAYSEEDQEDLLWMVGYTRDVLRGSRRELCELLNCDWSTAYRVLTGSYKASTSRFMETVRRLRSKASEPGGGFVDTIVTKKIFQVLDLARDNGAIVHICGPSRRSKTAAVKEWQRRNNHGRAIYIDCPVIGGARALLVALAQKAGIHTQRATNDLSERIEKSFDYRNVIIIDEAVRLLPKSRGHDLMPLEFLRRLHDVSGCGLAFVSTDVFRREMESGAISDFLEQLLGRIEEPLYIPAKVSNAEAGDICRAFNENADIELIRLAARIANCRGKVGVLFMLLRDAAKLAKRKKEALSAVHLETARAFRDGIHRWPEDED